MKKLKEAKMTIMGVQEKIWGYHIKPISKTTFYFLTVEEAKQRGIIK